MKVTISGFYDEYSFSFDEQLEIITKLSESYLCPRVIDGKNISNYTFEEFEDKIKPKLVAKGIKLSSIGSPIGKVGIDDEEGYQKQLSKLKELVKICKSVDCKYIRVFSFFMPKGGDISSYRDKVLEKLKGFLALVEGTDIILLHENEKHIYGDTATRCLDIYQSLNHPNLKLIYDASNFIQCNVDPIEAYEMLKEYVVYYHIKDCDKQTKVEVPLGTGDGCYAQILDDLNKRGYEGFMTLEPHTHKYALLRKPIYFIPFMPLIMGNFFKAFRKIDKSLNKSVFSQVTKKEMYLIQYGNLVKLLNEVGNG